MPASRNAKRTPTATFALILAIAAASTALTDSSDSPFSSIGAFAFPQMQFAIPNGNNVYRNGKHWPTVGHEAHGRDYDDEEEVNEDKKDENQTKSDNSSDSNKPFKRGEKKKKKTMKEKGITNNLNSFGMMMKVEGMHWTQTTCNADPDGDGYTNGEELGDPDCLWTKGQLPSRINDISHPGYADSFPRSFKSRSQIAAEAMAVEMEELKATMHRDLERARKSRSTGGKGDGDVDAAAASDDDALSAANEEKAVKAVIARERRRHLKTASSLQMNEKNEAKDEEGEGKRADDAADNEVDVSFFSQEQEKELINKISVVRKEFAEKRIERREAELEAEKDKMRKAYLVELRRRELAVADAVLKNKKIRENQQPEAENEFDYEKEVNTDDYREVSIDENALTPESALTPSQLLSFEFGEENQGEASYSFQTQPYGGLDIPSAADVLDEILMGKQNVQYQQKERSAEVVVDKASEEEFSHDTDTFRKAKASQQPSSGNDDEEEAHPSSPTFKNVHDEL